MKNILVTIFALILLLLAAPIASAAPALGIHLLDPNELTQAIDLVAGSSEEAGAVTVVLRTDDHKLTKWQRFFDIAAENNITPLVRLATTMETYGWRQPVKKDIVSHAQFLSFLNWHTSSLPVVVFNEPNHAGEWGGEVDPESYAEILSFALNWFHTEQKTYTVLPAGLDAAAPNGPSTMESFTFLEQMLATHPLLIDEIDAWASHSYPNPGFVASPQDSGKASISGYEHELAFLKKYSDRELDVYITETGWRNTSKTVNLLDDYYTYAIENVWAKDKVKAVTPFVFAAHSGPFQEFSFINSDGSPTANYLALKKFKPGTNSQISLLVDQF